MSAPMRIGVAVADEAAFRRLPETLPEPLTLLAVPGEVPESAEARRKLAGFRKKGVTVSIGELAAGGLTRLIPEESRNVQLDFFRMATERCRKAAEAGCDEFCLGVDLERAIREEPFRKRLLRLLPGFFGMAAAARMRMRLPIRIPTPPGSPELRAYRDMLAGILPEGAAGILLDFHMHDPAVPELDFEALLRPVRFDSDAWQISYEPGLGNRFVPETMRRILTAAGTLCRKPRRVWFAAGQELEELAEYAKGLSL